MTNNINHLILIWLFNEAKVVSFHSSLFFCLIYYQQVRYYACFFEYINQVQYGNKRMQTGGPHGDNFNINSNLNVLNQKNKSIAGKRIIKTQNASHLQTYYHQIECKITKKNQQNSLKKANQTKNTTQSKKHQKKKNLSIHKNPQTLDAFNDRRVKTEGPSNDIEIMPTVKKDKKSHTKSISQVGNKNTQPIKKQKVAKPIKASKEKHVKSCEVYGVWKRFPDPPEHTISETIHGGIPKKKRNNSSLICNDKVVSKLLNVSLLASEIGGSQPVTSDRKSAQSSHSKTLREYMNSIDLRIIRNIQDDVPIFLQKESTFQDTIRSIMKKNQISLEQLTRKVCKIQRAWRKRQRTSVINTYKHMFQKATDNFFKQDRLEQVSCIDISIQKSDSNMEFDIFHNQNLAASLKKSEGKSYKNSLEDIQNEDYRMRWIQESQEKDSASFDDEDEGLNIGKYRQLVKDEIKNLNKKIAIQNQQKKGGLDSKYLLEELMKHNFNKKWIEEESSSLSDRRQQKIQQIIPSQFQSQSADVQGSINQHTIETYHKQSKNDEEDGSFDDSQVYDRNKYAMPLVSEENKRQNEEILHHQINQQIIKIQKIEIDIKPKQESMDMQWINRQLTQDEVIVKNYLDCGLDNFSLQINEVQQKKVEYSQEVLSDKDHHSSDEAIGQKFQRANIAILRKRQVKKLQPEQESRHLVSKDKGQKLISLVVNDMLNEFAQDISVILKKSNNSLSDRPKNARPIGHSPGIGTSYSSIKQFVANLIAFISQREEIMTKITENINKDIGPSSLQILSYLRPEIQDIEATQETDNQSQAYDDDEDGLFVIPSQLFEEFQAYIHAEYQRVHKKQMGVRIKGYLSFWNRCVFEGYNECLDYQRPFGVEGQPYDWLKEKKVRRIIPRQKIPFHLQRAQKRLMDQTQIVAGIIFQRQDPMLYGGQISQEQMHLMNEQRLSRILAAELLQSQRAWINYNDEIAELMVELSRVIQQKLFFEFSGSELKKLMRHRRMLAEECYIEQSVEFNLDELQ